MISDQDLERALDWLRDNANAAAKARAERLYLEEWLGSKRAQLAAGFMASGASAAAADMQAKASPEYQEALDGFKAAVEADERLRWHRTRADAVIEVYRTQAATRRAMEKVT